MIRIILIVAVYVFGVCAPAMLRAENIGTLGPIYPIAEKDLLQLIQKTLHDKERSGELDRLKKEAIARSERSVENPKPIPGLSKSVTARSFYFDPSVTATRNITDPSGRIVVTAGTKVNPLDYVSMSRHLLFFDARDKAQVKQAEELIRYYQGRVKPILTGGSYMGLMRKWKASVFYDQDGTLVKKFGIEHVPAIVSQEGKRLRVDEIVL